MENILKKIAEFDKVNETKLAKHEVELGSLDMIKSMLNDSNATYKKGVEWSKEMEAFTKKAKVLNAEAKGILNGLQKELNDFKQKANELGLKVDSIPEFKKAVDSLGPLDNIIKMTQKYA